MDRNNEPRAGGHAPGAARDGARPGFRLRRGRAPAGRTLRANGATRVLARAARRPARSTAAVAAAILLALGGPATAHSRPETTAPADGEVVAAAPAVVSISFDKPMRVTFIELTNEDGDAFALERTDAMAPVTRFEATPPPLPAGRFTVEWRGLSEDGHAMRGRFSFEVRP